jgi:hypothetical protein
MFQIENLHDLEQSKNKQTFTVMHCLFVLISLLIIFGCAIVVWSNNSIRFNILVISNDFDENVQINNDDLHENKCLSSEYKKKGNRMLSYGPGDYILTSKDYYCKDYLLIELWAGGASGGMDYCCKRGGGSGAYIKANIKTHQQNIIMHVGQGGIVTDYIVSREWKCNTIFGSGQDSWILCGKLNLTVGGGITGCNISSNVMGMGGSVSIKNTNDIIAISGNNGTYSQKMSDMPIFCSGSGGSAPFGGTGGTLTCGINPNCDNGKLPGGGGNSGCVGTSLHKGGDGMINIYF